MTTITEMPAVAFVMIAAVASAIGWIAGEAMSRPVLRRICGPLFTLLTGMIVGVAVGLNTSFNDSFTYSSATRKFVQALVFAIDNGHDEESQTELRRFNREAIETYEGGVFLRALREPTDRLNALPAADVPSPNHVP